MKGEGAASQHKWWNHKSSFSCYWRKGPELISRNWSDPLGLKFPDEIFSIGSDDNIPNVFMKGLDEYVGDPVVIPIMENAITIFCRAKPVPFTVGERFDKELDIIIEVGFFDQSNIQNGGHYLSFSVVKS